MTDSAVLNDCHAPYPIYGLGRDDRGSLTDFVASLDPAGMHARFHRHMTGEMIQAHYRAIAWDSTVVLGWMVGGAIKGVAEAILHAGPDGIQAEIALCVVQGWRGRGIGQALVARADAAASRRGARRSVLVLAPGECAGIRIARRLGGTVDHDGGFAILTH